MKAKHDVSASCSGRLVFPLKMSVVRIFETGKIAWEGSIWPIGCFPLGGSFQVPQAAQSDGLLLDDFPYL